MKEMERNEKKEIIDRIATKFVMLPENGKSYIAGYIAGMEEAQRRKEEKKKDEMMLV